MDPRVWELTLRRDGLEVYTQINSNININSNSTVDDDMLVVKARCTIYRPAHSILRAVSTPAVKLRFDASLAACHTVREFDDTFKIVRYHFKSHSIIAKDRDAIWCARAYRCAVFFLKKIFPQRRHLAPGQQRRLLLHQPVGAL